MEFIKRNLIFLIISTVCVIALLFCFVLCLQENSRLKDQMAQTDQMQKYLKKVSNKRVKLVQENVVMAQKNEAEVKKVKETFLKDLRETYQLKDYAQTDIPLDALRNIQTAIQMLRNKLQDNDIDMSQAVANLGFDSLINSTTPPKKEDLPKMFRRLAVTQMLVDKLIEAKDKEDTNPIHLQKLEFGKGMDVQDEQYYTITPVLIEITASATEGQKLINNLVRMKKLLGFVRCIAIKSPSQPTAVFTSMAGASASSSNSGRSMDERMPEGRRGGAPMENRRTQPGAEETTTRSGNEANWVEIEKMRHDYMAFEKGRVTWTLNVELLEAKKPEKKEEPPAEKKQGDGAPMPGPAGM